MADEDDASKTEEPTDKKLTEAKRKGNIAQSQEIKHWGVLLAATATLVMLAPMMATNIRKTIYPFIQQPHAVSFDFEHLRLTLWNTIGDVFLILTPFLALMVVAALVSNIGQFGLNISTEKIKPDFGKLSLLKGLKKMFSVRSTVEFLKGILKLVVVSVVSAYLAMPLLGDIELLPQVDFGYSLDKIHTIAILMTAGTVGVMTVIAALDFVFQKFQHMKQMRMTKQEVKDEQKQQDGDPQVKARIRRVRMERAQQRMMQAVEEADVVITNPTHYAVALSYKMSEMAAPKLVGKGVDHLAFRIRDVAEANDIPLVENPPLARALYASVELDEEIPAEHFKAVAEVIGFVMRKRGDLPRQSHLD